MQDTNKSNVLEGIFGKTVSPEQWEQFQEYKKNKGPKVLIIREKLWKGIISDAVTFAMVVGVIGVGWFLNSAAMQWAGFLMLGITLLATIGIHKKVTISQARAKLDEWEKEATR